MEEHFFEIIGYKSRNIPCELIIPNAKAKDIALVLPGAGYSADRPLLDFATSILLKKNYKVVLAHTNYSKFPAYRELIKNHDRDKVAKLVLEEAYAIGQALSAQGLTPHTIIGKSAGTRAMQVLVPALETQKNIWLTPALTDWSILKNLPKSDLVVVGSADEYYVQASSFLPVNTLLIPDADHSLEHPMDLSQTFETLENVMKKISSHLSCD